MRNLECGRSVLSGGGGRCQTVTTKYAVCDLLLIFVGFFGFWDFLFFIYLETT